MRVSARLKDLSLVPVKPDDSQSEKIVERLIFGSGRPVLMCPEEFAAELRGGVRSCRDRLGSYRAGRKSGCRCAAVASGGGDVRIITATDSKTPRNWSPGRAVSHLAEHGIKARFETVKIDGSSVGKVFEAYVNANAIDLLVMGAYRHSRLNEIVWGGATKTVIGRPPCWVMMSR